ncbi:MAG: beta-ketoacyl-ACP synthase II [Anaerolineales bacterium]|jgi:3-oxoacyl-[acyl-carrier-protein] synthase II
MNDRVVITGIGTINALGLSVKETWENAVNGVSGVAPITLFDPSELLVQIACEVKDFIPEIYMSVRQARRRDRFQQFASVAAKEAIDQAGLDIQESESGRVGVIVSSAIGGVKAFENSVYTLIEDGARRISPFVIPMLMSNGAAGLIAIDYGYYGPCFSVGSACASGADGIGIAWQLIRSGVIDVAITGASDATITPVAVAAFDRLGAMSRRNDDYFMTPRPFDLNRDGLVMGEGAAILVLERESRARRRGAKILAELAGYASTSDAFHITAPSDTGEGGARAMRMAMQTARIKPEDVDYINAHGTATQLNDISETLAIKAALGDLAYQIPVSSTKSMTGHMMGTTGAVEAMLCVMAIQESVIPPTIHYETPDPECDLDYVPNEAREKRVDVILSNAFGFGGHNAVLALKSYS